MSGTHGAGWYSTVCRVSGGLPLGYMNTEAMHLEDLGKASPGGGLSFSHIHWDSVLSGVRLGPTLCGFHGSST